MGALGMELSDLYPSDNGRREVEAEYDYEDEEGNLLFQVVRFRPKTFRQRAPDGTGGWNWSTSGVRRVLYRLPEVLEAVEAGERVFVVEGEKDADRLAKQGICATTNPGGAGKWRAGYTRTLAGARVGIIADADDPGRNHAWRVAGELEDVAETVAVFEPEYGNDVSDHLNAGLGLGDLEQVQAPEDDSQGSGVFSLADLLADPEALAPPEVVVPRMAWRGRVVLFAAREKLGKSTTARAGCAAVTRGRTFLGDPASSGRVLYLALEEHLSDVARSFQTFGADPERTFILDRVGEPFVDLEAAVREVKPSLVVVDTLAAFVETLGLDPGSSSDWTPVMARLSRFARDADVALELLHHGTKRDGRYRDSTAIGAGVDAILEMSEGAESSLRTIRARARWRLDDYALRMVNGDDRPRFELSSGELSLDARVLMYLEQNPGASTRQVRENVEGKALDISTTLTRLEREGAVKNEGPGQRHEWHLADGDSTGSGQPPGTGSGTGTGSAEDPYGTATEPVTGTGAVPDSQPLEPHHGNRCECGAEIDPSADACGGCKAKELGWD